LAIAINDLQGVIDGHKGCSSVSGVLVREFLYHFPVFINNNAMAEASSPFTGL
jgi:hypothetical protein